MAGEKRRVTCDTCGQPVWGHMPTSEDGAITGRWFCIDHAPNEFREKLPPIPKDFPPVLRHFFASANWPRESKKEHLPILQKVVSRFERGDLPSDVKAVLRAYVERLTAEVETDEGI
jgi:hypothetical protein